MPRSRRSPAFTIRSRASALRPCRHGFAWPMTTSRHPPGSRTSPTWSVRRTTSSTTQRAAACWTGTIGTRCGSSTAPLRIRTRQRQRHSTPGSLTERWNGGRSRRSTPTATRRHRQPDEPTVEGIVVRVMLEPWGGGIRPHEHTMPGPKADRLALLGATRTQLSPILAVYFDASQPARLARPCARR